VLDRPLPVADFSFRAGDIVRSDSDAASLVLFCFYFFFHKGTTAGETL
jgi:hypothetical protein